MSSRVCTVCMCECFIQPTLTLESLLAKAPVERMYRG